MYYRKPIEIGSNGSD